MKDDSIRKIEKVLMRIFLILALIVVVGIVLLIRSDKGTVSKESFGTDQAEADSYNWEAGLTDSTLWLPENCDLYTKVPDFLFYDKEGMEYQISDFEGKPTVVVFWASWCSDCQEQIPLMKGFQEAADQYGDINYVFINKTDGNRETRESADTYISKYQLKGGFYYDTDLKAYGMLGMHNIPTTLFLDQEGIVQAWSPAQIKEAGVFAALVQNMICGSGSVTAQFIKEKMMDENGGVHSLYDQDANIMKQSDVLSESQGAMLEYAVLVNDKELFELIWSYIEAKMLNQGLVAWIVTKDEASKVNALIDDLRIYSALTAAQGLWGGYEEILAQYEENLLNYGMKNQKYIDFYDARSKGYADRFTLCYADLRTMEILAGKGAEFSAACRSALEIVENGQISEEFPLYYSWYNYTRNRYEEDDLNAAEAMVVLLHLAEAGKLPNNTLNWLKARMQKDGVKARYSVDGQVVSGYNFDSTAVNALIVMIADEIGDMELRGLALKKMEKMHIIDASLPYNGAFGLADGTEITSFDQIMPLLAYQYSE